MTVTPWTPNSIFVGCLIRHPLFPFVFYRDWRFWFKYINIELFKVVEKNSTEIDVEFQKFKLISTWFFETTNVTSMTNDILSSTSGHKTTSRSKSRFYLHWHILCERISTAKLKHINEWHRFWNLIENRHLKTVQKFGHLSSPNSNG